MIKQYNDDVSISIRKYRDILAVTGRGILMFGLWSIAKGVLMMTVDENDEMRKVFNDLLSDMTQHGLSGVQRAAVLGVFVVLIMIFIMISLSVRYYIFRNSVKESRGEKCGSMYLIAAEILVFLSALSLVSMVGELKRGDGEIGDSIVRLAVELTSMITLIEMIYSAFRIRKLTAMQAEYTASQKHNDRAAKG